MPETLAERVLSTFSLTRDQRAAALERERDVVVTAGAGSGKTRTLVARYVSLLADGLLPRRVVAITFTKKAAREMRARVREALTGLAQQTKDEAERQRWLALSAQMDAARIGTIHSLCTEILHAHPAEAGIDPRFDVLDEGLTAALRAQIVAETLQALVEQPASEPLLKAFGTAGMQTLLETLLNRRLEAAEAFEQSLDNHRLIQQALSTALVTPALVEPIAELRSLTPEALLQSEGDKLAGMVAELLALWHAAEAALARGDELGCAEALFRARREKMKGNLGKRDSTVKETVSALKEAYDLGLDPWLGGANSQDVPPDPASEALFEQLQPLVRTAFQQLHQAYQAALQQRQSLDFDDLEAGAVRLLRRADLQLRWQRELDALLVDEFQDTNARQRELVEALAGSPGRLFLVGDSRQSIYRFRQADVTVFRAIQARIKAQGGLVLDLDLTYRAHAPLLQVTGDLLAAVMGTEPDPARPFYVPFSPLSAYREAAPSQVSGAHIELVLGVDKDAGTARPAAARALAVRLLELKAAGQIRSWDEVTLLFRASTGFTHYEAAFEAVGLPFVTVAGRGFYDRPEIRDVLNLLRALADPGDDLAMAGLLRSPAFGLTDAALYQLRLPGKETVPYLTALRGDLSGLNETDHVRALRAIQILTNLLPWVDRSPVAELLKRLIDATDYRAILAADDTTGTGGRLWRNLDKLLEAAQTSRQVNVRDFLEYLATLSDAGAREGEAPAEALGAIRLMTIHKSKGLEFPVVILADAGREPRGGGEAAYLLPEFGLAFKLEPAPLLYRLSKWRDGQQGEAETQRLLYVALTRAKDKLLISGHAAPARSGSAPTVSAWLADLCAAANVTLEAVLDAAGTPLEARTASDQVLRVWCLPADQHLDAAEVATQVVAAETEALALYPPLSIPVPTLVEEDEPEPLRIWRATGTGAQIPPSVTGQLVHKALELWLFPDDRRLIPMLETAALNAGLASPEQRIEAVRRARELLEHFQTHPLWEELDTAFERHHEVPYSRLVGEQAETGYLDLLYRTASGWQILDFKTDSIHNLAQREALVASYTRQMQRYIRAVESLLGAPADARICFLDDQGKIGLVAV